jgi:tetratricopeptide (TPR) repeat protein
VKIVRFWLANSFIILSLVGCVSTGPRDLPPVEDTAPPVDDRPVETLPPVEDAPVENVPPVQRPEPVINPAVTSLINQARAQYNARNYQVAVATAERGLRIDRRAAELYLILAQSYLQLALPQQAEQFAQQGLRYAQTGSLVAESLLRVREILSGSQY